MQWRYLQRPFASPHLQSKHITSVFDCLNPESQVFNNALLCSGIGGGTCFGFFFISLSLFIFYRTQVQSLPCLVTESVCALVEFCSNWICQSCKMNFSMQLDVFVKINRWISLSCYMDLSKFIHVFLELVTWISQSYFMYFLPFPQQNQAEV